MANIVLIHHYGYKQFSPSAVCLWMMWYVFSVVLDVAGVKFCLHIVLRHCLNCYCLCRF